jgi:hypothetical protein
MSVSNTLAGSISSDRTLSDAHYLLTQTTYVEAGVTLTINAGVTITAIPDDGLGVAPAFVVLQGGKLNALGTREAPITFTALMPDEEHDLLYRTDSAHGINGTIRARLSGKWGGVIILGNAPTNKPYMPQIEGCAPPVTRRRSSRRPFPPS